VDSGAAGNGGALRENFRDASICEHTPAAISAKPANTRNAEFQPKRVAR
jgi:hypothetical protein